MLLLPGLPREHHVPVGLGSRFRAVTGPPGGAGNMGDDAWEVTVAAAGLGSTFLTPGMGAGGTGLVVIGLQDTTGRAVAGNPLGVPLWPGKAAWRLDPLAARTPFAKLVVTLLPENGCLAAGDKPLTGPGPGISDPGLPAAIPAGGRTESPGVPPSEERGGVSMAALAPVTLGRS